MTGIENALQDLANVVTILAGLITLYQFMKGK
jgi:hypothetical protein|nr:MAG TPA: hypothetical protein [Caudoviricetes sp.]